MLKEKLQKLIDASAGKIPSEAKSIMSTATQAVADSMASRSIPGLGDLFPEFALTDSTGLEVCSRELVKEHQLIVTFFRGGW